MSATATAAAPTQIPGTMPSTKSCGAPGHVSLETLTLEERDGRTLARTISVYQSVEDRDAMVQSGMEKGVREGTERLEELLARLTATG